MKRFLATAVISNVFALFLVVFVDKGFRLELEFGGYCLLMVILILLATASTLEYNGTTRGDTVLIVEELKRDKPVQYITKNILGLHLFLSGLPAFFGYVISLVVK